MPDDLGSASEEDFNQNKPLAESKCEKREEEQILSGGQNPLLPTQDYSSKNDDSFFMNYPSRKREFIVPMDEVSHLLNREDGSAGAFFNMEVGDPEFENLLN